MKLVVSNVFLSNFSVTNIMKGRTYVKNFCALILSGETWSYVLLNKLVLNREHDEKGNDLVIYQGAISERENK